MAHDPRYPDAVFNVSSRGASFADLGWEGESLALIRAEVERKHGLKFSDADWDKCTSPWDIDALVAARRHSSAAHGNH